MAQSAEIYSYSTKHSAALPAGDGFTSALKTGISIYCPLVLRRIFPTPQIAEADRAFSSFKTTGFCGSRSFEHLSSPVRRLQAILFVSPTCPMMELEGSQSGFGINLGIAKSFRYRVNFEFQTIYVCLRERARSNVSSCHCRTLRLSRRWSLRFGR